MNLIASADDNWGIGCKGKLLCHVPADMRWFKAQTTGKIVVMGQLTLESLPGGQPLSNRINIVLSDNPDFFVEGCIVVHTLNDLFRETARYAKEDIFVIGGASVYALLLPYCHKAYITKFHHKFPADRFLPNLDDLPEWQRVTASEDQWFEGMRYNFCVYQNGNPKSICIN
jgi:dihydrofolate reductase